jgi:hypothetical protein
MSCRKSAGVMFSAVLRAELAELLELLELLLLELEPTGLVDDDIRIL